jgi:hypothetical protein
MKKEDIGHDDVTSFSHKRISTILRNPNHPHHAAAKAERDRRAMQRESIETFKQREMQTETKGAPKGYHFTRDGKLRKGDAGADGDGGAKLRSDPLDKQRSKIPPLPEKFANAAQKASKEANKHKLGESVELDEISPELAKRAFDARAKKHKAAMGSASGWDKRADKDAAKGDRAGASAAYSRARDKEDKANRMASKLDRSAKKAGVDGQKQYAKATDTRSPTQKYAAYRKDGGRLSYDDHKKRLREEETNEVLDTPKAMDSYRNKAKYSRDRAAKSAVATTLRSKDKAQRDHPAKDLKTMDKRTKGLKMADRNATMKIFKALRKEQVDLDEAKRKGAPKMTGDSVAIQRAKDAEHAKAMGRSVKTGRKLPKKTMTSTQMSLASLRKEEVKQVDEISKKTLGSYIKKAGPDADVQRAKAQRHSDAGDMADKDRDMYRHYGKSQRAMDKYKNRVKGINKAVDKLTKEATIPDGQTAMTKRPELTNNDKDKLAKIRKMLDREKKK